MDWRQGWQFTGKSDYYVDNLQQQRLLYAASEAKRTLVSVKPTFSHQCLTINFAFLDKIQVYMVQLEFCALARPPLSAFALEIQIFLPNSSQNITVLSNLEVLKRFQET